MREPGPFGNEDFQFLPPREQDVDEEYSDEEEDDGGDEDDGDDEVEDDYLTKLANMVGKMFR